MLLCTFKRFLDNIKATENEAIYYAIKVALMASWLKVFIESNAKMVIDAFSSSNPFRVVALGMH